MATPAGCAEKDCKEKDPWNRKMIHESIIQYTEDCQYKILINNPIIKMMRSRITHINADYCVSFSQEFYPYIRLKPLPPVRNKQSGDIYFVSLCRCYLKVQDWARTVVNHCKYIFGQLDRHPKSADLQTVSDRSHGLLTTYWMDVYLVLMLSCPRLLNISRSTAFDIFAGEVFSLFLLLGIFGEKSTIVQ